MRSQIQSVGYKQKGFRRKSEQNWQRDVSVGATHGFGGNAGMLG